MAGLLALSLGVSTLFGLLAGLCFVFYGTSFSKSLRVMGGITLGIIMATTVTSFILLAMWPPINLIFGAIGTGILVLTVIIILKYDAKKRGDGFDNAVS